ncbi:hypothetical protein Ddye_019647 [Dipteronia dyeriana]|uniref:Uncharacterized protein n=1 Tax=Dipteronia dyeriana TaxID=168575 RepID=A0AAD9TYG8_9ROSI|nr:hypothetical protein Ddye_019647 [Dipteronia dyeriana]
MHLYYSTWISWKLCATSCINKAITGLDFDVLFRISYKHREGALMAFECLCENLGSLFEQYVNQMLPLPLVSFSDQVFEVLKAAECAARAMMS